MRQSGAKLPSGKHTKNYGKSPFLMGKSTISMAMFNSYVKLPEGNPAPIGRWWLLPLRLAPRPGKWALRWLFFKGRSKKRAWYEYEPKTHKQHVKAPGISQKYPKYIPNVPLIPPFSSTVLAYIVDFMEWSLVVSVTGMIPAPRYRHRWDSKCCGFPIQWLGASSALQSYFSP